MATATPNSTVTAIRPNDRSAASGLRELRRYRELLLFLIWRDFKIRYKQTALGALWAIAQPVGLMAILALVLGRVQGLANGPAPYPVFVLAALVPWSLFSQGLLRSADSIVNAGSLLQKVYFPRLLLPLAAIGVQLIDYLFALGAMVVILVLFGVVPGFTAFWLIPLSALAAASALAFGLWLSAANVRFRDVRAALPFVVQLWLFASPVAYATSLVPAGARLLYELNPMVGVIDGFRWALFDDGPAPVEAVVISILVNSVVAVSGLIFFGRAEQDFVDVI